MNWKKSNQGISTNKLNMYTLLDLSNNQLFGKFPTSLGALKALKLLNISCNKLSGKIRTSFGDLENIETIDLSHNNLSGFIPSTLTKLQLLNIIISVMGTIVISFISLCNSILLLRVD